MWFQNCANSCWALLLSTLSTDGWAPSSRVRCGLDITITPSVSQSSGCFLHRVLCSVRPIPSFPCSSSMSRSCELLLFTMIGPILRRNIPSLYNGCTLEVSLVRRITDLSWKVDDIGRCGKLGLSDSPESPCWVTSTSRTGPAQEVPIKRQKCLSTGSRKRSGGLSSQMNLLAKAIHSLPFHSLLSSLLKTTQESGHAG